MCGGGPRFKKKEEKLCQGNTRWKRQGISA